MPYRSWPPKPSVDDGETLIPRALVREETNTKREHVDLVTVETLASLQHEGSPSNPVADPTTEGRANKTLRELLNVALLRPSKLVM
jgi:hypothetical protein